MIKMPYTKIWGSLSFLIGGVIGVLALVNEPWQHWLLLAAVLIWGLWLLVTILLPYAAAQKRQREFYSQQQPALSESRESQESRHVLLRHVNHRISAYLKSVYPNARWEWCEQQPERLILEGGTGRIRIFGVPDFGFADVQLDAQANLQCSLVKIVPLAQTDSAGGESGQFPPNQQPVDPRIWYEVQGRKVLEGLISDLNSRGHSGLEIGGDGSIHIKDAENDAHAALPGFPEKVYWPQLVKVLEGEGYAAEVKEDTVAVTW